ncbi:MAG: phosphotransferase family protein [Rudaea sp.]
MTVAVDERERNRVLRRADWRFLLPDPSPRRSVCFEDGLLRRAVESFSEELVGPADCPREDCDLAVAVDAGDPVLREAWQALRPGGSLYVEFYSPLVSRPAQLRRRLMRAGFDDIQFYWSPLSRKAAGFWLPLDSSAAAAYVYSHRPVARTRLRGFASSGLESTWTVIGRSGLLRPICVFARKPGAGTENPSGEKKEGEAFSRAMTRVLLAGGERSINKVTLLMFKAGEHDPRLAIKMPRMPEGRAAIARESAILERLQSLRPGGFAGVPRVEFCGERDGVLRLGETIVAGVPLFTMLHRDNFEQLAGKATDWLIELASGSKPAPRAEWWNGLIQPILAGPHLRGLLRPEEMQGIQANLDSVEMLPLVPEHRDFSPWNVMVADNGELGVLDWESAALPGLPQMDLTYFLTLLSLFLDGGLDTPNLRSNFRATLDPTTLTGRVVAACTARYATRVGVDASAQRALRVLTWLLHTRSEAGRLAADYPEELPGRRLNTGLFMTFLREELKTEGIGVSVPREVVLL